MPCKVGIEKHQIKKGIGIQAILEYLGMLKIYKDCTDKFRSPPSSKAEIIINNFFSFFAFAGIYVTAIMASSLEEGAIKLFL